MGMKCAEINLNFLGNGIALDFFSNSVIIVEQKFYKEIIGMTRILFLPDPHTLLWLEEEQPAEAILQALQRGEWLPPAPFHELPCADLRALQIEDMVLITRTAPRAVVQPYLPHLSRRQMEVLKGLAEGLTTRQIAYRLRISTRTVYLYVSDLKRRFDAGTRAELVRRAMIVLSSLRR